jgi:hypothetical protein
MYSQEQRIFLYPHQPLIPYLGYRRHFLSKKTAFLPYQNPAEEKHKDKDLDTALSLTEDINICDAAL